MTAVRSRDYPASLCTVLALMKTSKPGRLACIVDPCGGRAFRERILIPHPSPSAAVMDYRVLTPESAAILHMPE